MHDVARLMFDGALFEGRNVVLFEDQATSADLFPLAVLRPSWEIRCGAGYTRLWLSQISRSGRPPILKPRHGWEAVASRMASTSDNFDRDAETVFINGRVIALWVNSDKAAELPDTVVDTRGHALLARRSGSQAEHLLNLSGNEIADSLVQEGGTAYGNELGWTLTSARFVWDYMVNNESVLRRQLETDKRDVPEMMGAHVSREMPAGAHLTDRMTGHPVYVGPATRIHPGVVLGNHHGPIWIGGGTEIEPHAYLEGPIYVGSHCRVKAGARLYHGTALGDHCRVAGEISQSVFQGFVNKQHDGFVGNSVLGEWVNLGADTRTSNLRNDYGEVKVQVGGELVLTGERFIGLLAGDHVKTGINTMFNTGTVVGVAANVHGAGYPPRFINSFQVGGTGGFKAASLERTLDTARFVMSRRGRELSAAEEELMRRHYAETITEESQK